jgi:LPS sulfotransferase NodH
MAPPDVERPHKCVVVCMTPRSGSSLLCDYLGQTGAAGQPEEYFLADDWPSLLQRHGVDDAAGVVASVVRAGTSPNGVCSMKIGIGGGYLGRLLRAVEDATGEAGVDGVWSAFGRPLWIWTTRRDKVRQAISWWRATKTGRWRSSERGEPDPEHVDHDAVTHLLREIAHREAAWDRFFADSGIAPFTVVYEDFVRRREKTLKALFLDLDEEPRRMPVDSILRPQADARTEAWRTEVIDHAEIGWINPTFEP